jgi:hypothetical protein
VSAASRQLERAVRLSLLVVLAATVALYAAFAVGDHPNAFGFNQLRHLADTALAAPIAGLLAWGAVSSILAGRQPLRSRWAERFLEVGVAALAFVVFYAARTNFINPDGRDFSWRFAQDVPVKGYFATHDEILELALHSRAWYYTNRWWGWDVPRTYVWFSCAAGAAFIVLLDRFARREPPARPIVMAGVLSGG